MNPGPFGMMQTGVPFGEIAAVRDWMGVGPVAAAGRRAPEAPDRRLRAGAEVSGKRLWDGRPRWLRPAFFERVSC